MKSKTVKVTAASLIALGLMVTPALSGDFAKAATTVTRDSTGTI